MPAAVPRRNRPGYLPSLAALAAAVLQALGARAWLAAALSGEVVVAERVARQIRATWNMLAEQAATMMLDLRLAAERPALSMAGPVAMARTGTRYALARAAAAAAGRIPVRAEQVAQAVFLAAVAVAAAAGRRRAARAARAGEAK